MHSAIENMLEAYNCQTTDDYKNALKEIVQEIALLGLYRGGFFNKAAFYGGTALRIFYGLDRFSEDLDFSLLEPDLNFDLATYSAAVQDELGAFGLDMTVTEKIKKNDSPVKSAFIKGGTQIHLLQIASITPPVTGVVAREQIKIKLEVDTDPPAGAEFESKYQLNPVPYYVRLYAPSSLFAGKVHAILCRGWMSRVKGRDFYDYVWYLSKGIAVNMSHLKARMIQSGHLTVEEPWDEMTLRQRLDERFQNVNFEQAKNDVLAFIKNPDVLSLWSTDFFQSITKDQLKIETTAN
jgi:predicted nucleotidyltransferase component of viral defense system